jgi:hypothetical protein
VPAAKQFSLIAMSQPLRHRRVRRNAWLALLALWLQVLAPVIHDSAMASSGAAGFDSAHHLCEAPVSQPADSGSPDTAPAHHLPACAAVCQAIHAAGGFAPPTAPALLVPRVYGAAYQPAFDAPVSQRWSRTSQQPRAPPILV